MIDTIYKLHNDVYAPNKIDFPVLWEIYGRNLDFHHEYMAEHYRTIMTNALKRYAQSAGIQVSDAQIESVVWSGLTGTLAWKALDEDEKVRHKRNQTQQVFGGGCPR